VKSHGLGEPDIIELVSYSPCIYNVEYHELDKGHLLKGPDIEGPHTKKCSGICYWDSLAVVAIKCDPTIR